MNGGDAVWNGINTGGGEPSDGFINGNGQVYPNALLNIVIPGGDSHRGQTRSPEVRIRLRDVMRDQFGVQISQ